MIGFDEDTWLAYEGVSNYGHGIWPAPLVLRATFVQSESDWGKLPNSGKLRDAKHVFREDYYDPVTRIRRGRFYEWAGGRPQPDQWWVYRHPTLPEEGGTKNAEGMRQKSLVSFTPMQTLEQRLVAAPTTLIILGARQAVTVWNVVSIEKTGNDEDVVTMRARSNLGFLPDLVEDAIPVEAKERVTAAVAKVVDAAHRSSGIAIVDLCRDAAIVVLSAYLVQQGGGRQTLEQDLGPLISALPPGAKLWRGATDVIRLLHPRGKSNEQQKYGTRTVTESDGMLALEAFGFLLRDIGWAR